MVENKHYKVGTKVRLLRATCAGEDAVVLEQIAPQPVSRGQYSSSAAGVGVQAAMRYRVQVIRTRQELIERDSVIQPCEDTEFDA
jgi:hypothetical protein